MVRVDVVCIWIASGRNGNRLKIKQTKRTKRSWLEEWLEALDGEGEVGIGRCEVGITVQHACHERVTRRRARGVLAHVLLVRKNLLGECGSDVDIEGGRVELPEVEFVDIPSGAGSWEEQAAARGRSRSNVKGELARTLVVWMIAY